MRPPQALAPRVLLQLKVGKAGKRRQHTHVTVFGLAVVTAPPRPTVIQSMESMAETAEWQRVRERCEAEREGARKVP